MVLKVLLLVLVVLVLAVLLGTRRRPTQPERPARRAAPTPQPLPMLACAHCGVHLPQAEAIVDPSGRGFGCEAHRVAGPA